jgi:hypothetical protein
MAVKFVKAAEESRAIGRQTEAVITSMGNASNITAAEVANLAEKLSKKAGIDDELIQSGQNVLLTFAAVRNEVGEGNQIFDRATTAALDMSVALGQDMQSSVTQLGKALNDPISGITALTRVGIQFTDQQKEQIKALVESGDTLGAQKIILDEVEKQFTGSAEAQATASGKLQVAWENLQESLGALLLPAFERVATWLTDTGVPAVEGMATTVSETLGPILSDLAGWIEETGLPTLRKLGDVIAEEVGPTWRTFVTWITEELLPNLQELWGIIEEDVAPALGRLAGRVRDELLPAFKELWDSVSELIAVFTDGVAKTGETETAFDALETALFFLFAAVQGTIGGLTMLFKILSMVADAVRWVIERILGFNAVIWGGVLGAIGAVADAFRAVWRAVSSAVQVIESFFQISDKAKSAAGGIAGKVAGAFGVSVKKEAHGGITGAAGGGARSGWTMVGEHGIELIKLPAGTPVKGNAMTQNMLAGAGTGGGTVRLVIDTAGSGLDQVLVEILRRVIKSDFGGDVQVAMGAA